MPLSKKSSTSVWIVVINKKSRKPLYLLAERSESVNNPGYWNFFGGRVDKGENPDIAAKRELFEESKFKFKNLTPYGALPYNNATFCYYTVFVDGLISPKLNDENKKFAWMDLVSILKLDLHVPTRLFFQHYVLPFVKI